MSSGSKQTVFLVGATGKTGSSIVRALAKQPEKFVRRLSIKHSMRSLTFHSYTQLVKALVRAASLDKPSVQELKSLGVEFISGDIVKDSHATLENHLKDVDTVIITTVPFQPKQQDKLILAAKNANVKRVVPSDFGPSAPPGAMKYQDSVGV